MQGSQERRVGQKVVEERNLDQGQVGDSSVESRVKYKALAVLANYHQLGTLQYCFACI